MNVMKEGKKGGKWGRERVVFYKFDTPRKRKWEERPSTSIHFVPREKENGFGNKCF